jgi:hypothetical protein
MRAARSLLLALLLPVLSAAAQAPTVDSTAVAARIDRLPVLDDAGDVISEELIQFTMRPPRWVIRRPLLGALTGFVVFALASDPGRNCSPYEPCSPREKWTRDVGPLLGIFVGAVVGIALPDQSIDRWRAVEIIRAERRAASTPALTPPADR